MKTIFKFLKEAFSEQGRPSSRRILGGLLIVTCCFCIIFSLIKYGMNDNVSNTINVALISGVSLMGVTSVANILTKKGNNQ